MNTENTRIQMTVSAKLAAAIRQVAKEELRTSPCCIVNILLNTPAIQAALKRLEEAAVVRNPAPVVAVPIAPLPPQGPDEPWIPLYKRQEMAAAAAALASSKT